MNTKSVSATNVRVNLTEVISGLDANNRVAITKHGKVIAYLVTHVEEEVAIDPDPAEEARKSQFHEILDEEEEEEVEVDAGELACETTAGPNYEPDEDLDDESFDDYIADLRRQTMSLGFITN
jgi:antitoxin (DNA-binding transcriptional repressor) of toxin-antitoxin stability system